MAGPPASLEKYRGGVGGGGADSGEFFLDESGFYFMPTCEDMRLMMIEGERIYIEELQRDMRKEFYTSE